MGSSYDAGYYASEASKAKRQSCPEGGEHKWKTFGMWPSTWEVCEKCDEHIYWK